MPKVILQFEEHTLKEYVVGARLTIGRLPDNAVMIDNGAVSGHHACIVREGEHFILEDLHSRNGTYVNERHVYRHKLRNGDVVLVGKHKLVFDEAAEGDAAAGQDEPTLPSMGDTVYLNTQKHRELLARLRSERWNPLNARAAAAAATAGSVGPTSKTGTLRVLAGRADRLEYQLDGRTALIGKSENALVRLRGWFSPAVALVITRDADTYVATASGGKPLVNRERLGSRHHLRDGDVLQVAGLTLEFRTK